MLDFIAAVLERTDRWRGIGQERPQRRIPVLGPLAIALGAVIASDYLRSHEVASLVFGALIVLTGVSALVKKLREPADGVYQRRLIAVLAGWVAELPRDAILVHPDTGERFGVERARGFLTLLVADPLTLLVADPPAGDPDQEQHMTVRRYPLALLGAPSPAPLLTHVGRLDTPMRWLALNEALRVNDQTGAMRVSTDELEELVGKTQRLVA